MKYKNQNKKKETSQKERTEISKLNDTINSLKKQINELLQLINQIVTDKYEENIVQKSMIVNKVQEISRIK